MRGLRVNSCTHHIRIYDGIAERFENLLNKRPVSMVSNIEGVMVDSPFTAKQDKCDANLAANQRGCKLRAYKRDMDDVCVANAIAATCGPAISFLVGRQADKRGGAVMQPYVLWAFLEETRVALIPSRAWSQ